MQIWNIWSILTHHLRHKLTVTVYCSFWLISTKLSDFANGDSRFPKMSLRCKVLFLCAIFLCRNVVMTSFEVIWVSRNATDSFRVGEDGCTNNVSVCAKSATCQTDGSCLCYPSTPNFRNPRAVFNNKTLYEGDSYGCIDTIIRFRIKKNGKCYCCR